jgi:hypothetical protein
MCRWEKAISGKTDLASKDNELLLLLLLLLLLFSAVVVVVVVPHYITINPENIS